MTDEERQGELKTYLYEATDLPSRQHVQPLLGAGGMVGVSLGTLRWLARGQTPPASTFQGVASAMRAAEQAIATVGEDEWTAVSGTGIRGEVQDVLSAMSRLRDILRRNGLAE